MVTELCMQEGGGRGGSWVSSIGVGGVKELLELDDLIGRAGRGMLLHDSCASEANETNSRERLSKSRHQTNNNI